MDACLEAGWFWLILRHCSKDRYAKPMAWLVCLAMTAVSAGHDLDMLDLDMADLDLSLDLDMLELVLLNWLC